ncbi:heme-binding domain-containing protein, partial [Gemmatimonadota bacterium]
MGRAAFKVSALVLAGVLLLQLVPVDRTNPPVTAEVVAPGAVMEILRTSCYDCHSNETTWPWYSRVAPVSWLIAKHVEMGREHVNFSHWGELSAEDRDHALEDIWEEVERGTMPHRGYLRW